MSIDSFVNALVLGSIYLMFSTGFTLVYGTFQVMNLAHGSVLTVGAFVGLMTANTLGLPLPVAFVTAALGAGTLNLVLDAVVIRPIRKASASYHRGADELSPIIATLAFSLVVAGVVQYYATNVTYIFENTGSLARPHDIAGVRVSTLEVCILLGAATLAVGIYLMVNRTRFGIMVRAVAEDSYMSSALGVRPGLVSASVFFISGALAGICGVVIGLLYTSVNPTMGTDLLLFGFVIVTVGGLGSLAGTAIASFIVALARTIAADHMSGPSIDIWVFALLLAVLLVRPAGLLGKRVLGSGVART